MYLQKSINVQKVNEKSMCLLPHAFQLQKTYTALEDIFSRPRNVKISLPILHQPARNIGFGVGEENWSEHPQ